MMRMCAYLEYAGTVRCSPCVKQVVFAGGNEPFAAGGKAQRQNAALVQMQLILVRFRCVQHLHMRVLHTHSQPVA